MDERPHKNTSSAARSKRPLVLKEEGATRSLVFVEPERNFVLVPTFELTRRPRTHLDLVFSQTSSLTGP